MTGRFPGGARFAFTIMDDTDVATIENVGPVYRLLHQLGFRTTKTVWPVGCPEGSRNFSSSQTLDEPAYVEFVQGLAAQGFEIAFHGATMESSERARTIAALERFRSLFGGPPRVYASHSYNRENLYWGVERLDVPILRALYARTNGQPPDWYQGTRPGSPWWWGDVAQETLTYVRNLSFDAINLTPINPSMPYRDPRRPLAPWWFSASDAEDVGEFNRLIDEAAQDRLEREGGVSIVATHLGKGFARDGRVDPTTERLLTRLAAKGGWFVPVGELLDWLRERRTEEFLPAAEWRAMQWRWARDLVTRRIRWKFR
ncbi:MAG: hypothetical protein JNJ80_01025 [Gemmatimonadetes bacterium]|nr:hypothetical protein [Gemmatimonadota bacterium]